MLSQEHIKVVKNSWASIQLLEPNMFGGLFYDRLFSMDASLRPMFGNHMESQYLKLIDMLTMIVSRLDEIEAMTDEIKELAIRHVAYGTKPEHYKLVGNSLLWALEKGLGDRWSPEISMSWGICYQLLADTMMEAAAQAPKKMPTH